MRICNIYVNFRRNYDDLEFTLKELRLVLFSTLDGCISSNPPKTEIMKIYVETFHTHYLLLIHNYWKICYENIDVSN
jgi:hypothetical protein